MYRISPTYFCLILQELTRVERVFPFLFRISRSEVSSFAVFVILISPKQWLVFLQNDPIRFTKSETHFASVPRSAYCQNPSSRFYATAVQDDPSGPILPKPTVNVSYLSVVCHRIYLNIWLKLVILPRKRFRDFLGKKLL